MSGVKLTSSPPQHAQNIQTNLSSSLDEDLLHISLTDSPLDEDFMYKIMWKNYLLTELQLVENGFPRPHPWEKGRAVLKISQKYLHGPDKQLLWCDRCGLEYRVDELGMQVKEAEGCKLGVQVKQQEGCRVKKVHRTNIPGYNDLKGFVATEDRSSGVENCGKVFAVDCEMANTKEGRELIRVTLIDFTGKTVFESLVKPDNLVFTYNTKFSGIGKKDMVGVTTRLKDVQAELLKKLSSSDILVGHSLQSDLKVLKLLHNTVVDTQVVFPHEKGGKVKSSLKDLSKVYLKRIIQTGAHDSFEDALASLDLMKVKVKEDVKILEQKEEKGR